MADTKTEAPKEATPKDVGVPIVPPFEVGDTVVRKAGIPGDEGIDWSGDFVVTAGHMANGVIKLDRTPVDAEGNGIGVGQLFAKDFDVSVPVATKKKEEAKKAEADKKPGLFGKSAPTEDHKNLHANKK
jgi:hypothetical protein